MFDLLREFLLQYGLIGAFVWTLLKVLVIAVPLILAVAFYTLFERKVIGWMHVRHGPQFVGGVMGIGVIQAFADVVIGFLVFGTALMMTGASLRAVQSALAKIHALLTPDQRKRLTYLLRTGALRL